jgi:hypothetical protein
MGPTGRKALNAFGYLLIALFVGGAGYMGFKVSYWDPRHRPVVVIAGDTRAPWKIEVDGVAQCASVPSARGEQGLTPCRFDLAVGDHVLVAKAADGSELHRVNARVEMGAEQYLWLPELPRDLCVFRQTVEYNKVQPIAFGFGSGPPAHPQLAAGFQGVGNVEDWFTPPPGQISTKSREASLSRVALRLQACSWRE